MVNIGMGELRECCDANITSKQYSRN